MRHAIWILLLLVQVVTFSTFANAPQDVTATLTVAPHDSLPGLPVAFHVHVENHTSHDVLLGGVRLHVVRSGETFDARTEAAATPLLPDVESRVLPAHATVDSGWPLDTTLTENVWFYDSRLCVPGDYTVRMTLTYDLPAAAETAKLGTSKARKTAKQASVPAQAIDGSADGNSTVIDTNDAAFRVMEPKGKDADVWKYLQNVAEDRPVRVGPWSVADWRRVNANEIFNRFPDSNYVPYVVGLMISEDIDTKVRNIDYAIGRFPNSPAVEMLRLAEANWYRRMSQLAASVDGDVSKATGLRTKAEGLYRTVLGQTRDPLYRRWSQQNLDSLPSREAIEREAARAHH